MDSLLKDNEKNVLCESFVIRLSPHHELLGKAYLESICESPNRVPNSQKLLKNCYFLSSLTVLCYSLQAAMNSYYCRQHNWECVV